MKKSLLIVAMIVVTGCFFDVDESHIGDTGELPPDTNPVDTTPVDTTTNTEADECYPGDVVEGIGDECNEDTDCVGSDDCAVAVDVCLKNPTTPSEPGACSVADCDPGCCPDGYQCCDCSDNAASVGFSVACLPDGFVSLVESSCTCS